METTSPAAPLPDVTEEIRRLDELLRGAFRDSPYAFTLQVGLVIALLFGCAIAIRALFSGMPRSREFGWPARFIDVLEGLGFIFVLPMALGWLAIRSGFSDFLPEPARQSTALFSAGIAQFAIAVLLVSRIVFHSGASMVTGGRHAPALLLRALFAYALFFPIFWASSAISRLVLHWNGIYPPLQGPLEAVLLGNARFLLLAAPIICLVVPLAEESVFRGALYPLLRSRFGVGVSMALCAAIFAVAHVNLAAIFPIFVLGLFLVWSLESSGSLIVPAFIHGLHNGLTLAFALLDASQR